MTIPRCSARLVAGARIAPRRPPVALYRPLAAQYQWRTLFNFFRRKPVEDGKPKDPQPVLGEDDLFHPFSKSPFPAVQGRGEAIKKLAACPVCLASDTHAHAHIHAQPKNVAFECPDCGWPTHCTEEHWAEDKEHEKYCSRLREANEDEHDLRSGRRMIEFEFPGTTVDYVLIHCADNTHVGPQDSEAAISFANWDTFWYTRGFPSMDTERSRRHASKVLSFPITIGSVLHQYSNLTLNNQRLTPEGSRSLAG
jgi:mitochondrial splicing suppressor protein 51